MRGYNPSLPSTSCVKYRTSRHGELVLEKKDSKVAQCVSCHGVHGIRGPDSPASLVYPENIPTTCGRCHADAAYMKGYTLDDGKTPIPTDQLEKYRKSVHGNALLKKHDKGAPACNGCHGNHAATAAPDGLRLAGLPQLPLGERHALRRKPAQEGSSRSTAGPNAKRATTTTSSTSPTDAMLEPGPKALCVDCHEKYGQPKCIETAAFFYTTISGLAGESAALGKEIDHLAETGIRRGRAPVPGQLGERRPPEDSPRHPRI